jgi:hypothetical protein
MAKEAGNEWFQSIGLPFAYNPADFSKFLKSPDPLNFKNTCQGACLNYNKAAVAKNISAMHSLHNLIHFNFRK